MTAVVLVQLHVQKGELTGCHALYAHALCTQSCCIHWRVQGDLLSPMHHWESRWCDHPCMMHSFMLHTLFSANAWVRAGVELSWAQSAHSRDATELSAGASADCCPIVSD